MYKKYTVYFLGLLMAAAFFMNGCKKIELKTTTTSDVNMVDYLANNPDSFSLFKQILDRVEYSPFLNAYGAYTVFAPTNSGVRTWLAGIGASSVEAADITVLKDMAKFHLLTDTITTGSFKDGKLPVPTMLGQYLITGVATDASGASFIINRQATVIKSNIKVGNGIIHIINSVLKPATLTLSKALEANPEYSIFVQAMKETGFFARLNTVNPDTANRWFTIIAESNRALADSGINSYAALKARYSQTGNPASLTDSLNMYVAYHVITGIKFLGDIIASPAHQTLQPQEVIGIQLLNQEVVVNQFEFNGVLERGVLLNRTRSDNAATNGVYHDASSHFTLKFRNPTAVYWDVSTFPEILKMPAFYKKQNAFFVRQSEADQPLKEITWGWGPLAGTNTLTYYYSTTVSISNGAVNNDLNMLPMGLPNRPVWWEMTTPPIIRGKYKIWLCYSSRKQSSSSNMLCQVSANGTVLPRTMNFTDTRPNGTDSELEPIGWKRYTESTASQYAGRLVGIYEFTTTQRQTIRITPLSGTQNDNYLDMIHFIPVDQNQVLPRFKVDGSKIFF